MLRAGLAHLGFVAIHPFDDGNGRIARVIADLTLSRSEGTPQRFYSMSAQIREERTAYYRVLERTQRGTTDVSEWMVWLVLNRLLDHPPDSPAKLSTSHWARMARCSQDSALRDITDLVERGVLVRNSGGGRSTSYALADT